VVADGGGEILIQPDRGEGISNVGQAVRYLNEANISLPEGTRVIIQGLIKDDHFEVQAVYNPGTKETKFLRDQTGKAVWVRKNRGSIPLFIERICFPSGKFCSIRL
jgi:hypothetical protein